ncbi:MAG: M48 family metalloprotease [Gammaproteobacteria bacterium]|nr:M48 family metalloprotease [Gammaproteobacteria bacterium]
MNVDELRYRNDKDLYDELLEERDVKRVNEHLEKLEAEGPTAIRRRLLSTSVRLSAAMAPDIQKMADECVERLGIEIPVELYVYSSPTFNAACFKPEAGRLYVMFSSSLLEGFEGSELRFVMGHEFGHYIYEHHDIPIGYLLKGKNPPGPKLALKLFAWSRYAEISADRAGAYCAQDMHGVARSLFKLASGLTGNTIRFNLSEFLGQVDEMQVVDAEPGQGAPQGDWFSTHPFSPLRVRALQLFHDSKLMKPDGTSVEDMDVGVQRLMSMMEPNYLEARTDAAIAMRHLLFAGAVVIASASEGVSEKEIEVFEQFFQKGDFNDRLNIERIREDLPSRIERVNQQTTHSQRMQVLRDLCLIAKAEGYATDEERAVLHQISDGLQISRNFVCQTLETDCEPD